MTQKITVLKGDGIGPEISDAVMRILQAAGSDVEFECFEVGENAAQNRSSFYFL